MWKAKYQTSKQDNRFLETHIKENKRQNQILKLAIFRLQTEFKKVKDNVGDTFLTQAGVDGEDDKKEMNLDHIFEILTR